MWIFTSGGFVSAVQHDKNSSCILVRARLRKHLYDIAGFSGTRIIRNMDADYPYRVEVDREVFASWLYRKAMNLDYDNYKDSVKDQRFKKILGDVWYKLTDLEKPGERIHPYLRFG
jgi:hypothetical protein